MKKLILNVGDVAYVLSGSTMIHKVVVTGISPTGRITTHQKRGDTMFDKTVWRPNGDEFSRGDRWNFKNLREADHPEVVRRITQAKKNILLGKIEDLIKAQSIEVEVLERVFSILKDDSNV